MRKKKSQALSLGEIDRRCKLLGITYGEYRELEYAGKLPKDFPEKQKEKKKKILKLEDEDWDWCHKFKVSKPKSVLETCPEKVLDYGSNAYKRYKEVQHV